MAMRLSGLISGMDTEAVIRELMNAERLKTTKVENKITTTEWKQEKWSALNSKIYSFYTNQLSKMRMAGSFAVKKAASSNIDKVDITAGSNAPEGTHLIKVDRLASSQFVTGAKLGTDDNGNEVSTSTRLVDLKDQEGLGFDSTKGTSIHIKAAGGKEVSLDIRENTTIGELINSLKSAGLNANYDAGQKRFFISSKSSGEENAFEITTSSSVQVQEKNAIRDFIAYDSLSSADKNMVNGYLNDYLNDTLTDEDKDVIKDKLLEFKHKQVRTQYVNNYVSDEANIDRVTPGVREELEAGLKEGETLDDKVLQSSIKDKLIQEAELKMATEFEAWKNNEAEEGNVFLVAEEALTPMLTQYADANSTPTSQTGSLASLGLGEITKNAEGVMGIDGNPDAVLVQASDAIIEYNGAKLTGSSNNFSVNGLNLTLKGETNVGETISLSVSNNTEAVYDMVKDFVNAYNELLKEMNDSYNAESARGYDPLTDEEREAMSESEIEKWESRIKDSLLRRDNTLGGLISSFRIAMSGSVSVNGKSYSLASFGVGSQSYKDKGTLHIYGDEDNDTTAGLKNKLMDALTSNSEEVMTVMNKLADDLHGSLMDKMKSSSLSSALTVYNDKEISKTLTNYKDDLKELETKLAVIEERYYKQFAAMETAMARLNSQSNALASMLGINMQG